MSNATVPLESLIQPAKTVRAGKSNYPVLSMTMRDGLVDQATKFKKRVASEDTSSYKVIRQGQLVVGFPIDEGVLSFQRQYPEAIVSPAYDVWDVISSEISIDYLEKFLRSPNALTFYAQKLRGSTARRRTLPDDVFLSLTVPLPPLPEQRRIASILDQADALRAKRREALAELDKLTQAIFIEMFGDPATGVTKFPQVPLENLLEEEFQNGAYYPKEQYCNSGGVEMVHMSDAFSGVIARGKLKRVSCSVDDMKKYCLSHDDIIIARRSLTYEGAAKPCMVPDTNEPLIFESSFIRVRPDKTRATPLYLYHYLNNDRIRQKFVRPFITQSTISGINQSNLAQVPVMQPPLQDQYEFGAAVSAIERVQKSFMESLAELDALFASLQYSAFRGEL